VIRPLPNGDMYAPHRGRPPPCPEGYYRDAGDPFIFHPVVDPCDYRGESTEPCNCGTPRIVMWCHARKERITMGNCKECQDGDAGTLSEII